MNREAIFKAEDVVREECEKVRDALVKTIRDRLMVEFPTVTAAEPRRLQAYSTVSGPKPIGDGRVDVNTYTCAMVLPLVTLEIS